MNSETRRWSRFGVLLVGCVVAQIGMASGSETTLYIVRHAEKAGRSGDVPLTLRGHQRAQELRNVLANARLSGVYSTEYRRTQQTAAPTARAARLKVTPYHQVTRAWANQVLDRHEDEHVLIVGHSNTVGSIITAFGGQGQYPIDDDEYDRLIVLTVRSSGTEVHAMRYGQLKPIGEVELAGNIIESKDLSAIAVAKRFLVVGADEGAAIQVMSATDNPQRFVAQAPIPLSDDPEDEIDIEGIARSGKHYYVIGSHSCKRKKVDPREQKTRERSYQKNRRRMATVEKPSERYRLFRFRLDPASGQLDSEIDRVNLLDLIRKQPSLQPFVRVPSKENGIDIEGVAADGRQLYVGLRGPVLRGGYAPVLTFHFDQPARGDLKYVRLGGLGIRDLVRVENGFLILAGPVAEIPSWFRLYHWDGRDTLPGTERAEPLGRVTLLGSIPAAVGERPEGLAVTAETDLTFSLLVVYDGIAGGRPTRFEVAKP